MTSLLRIQKHHQTLIGMIDDAIDLSNVHHDMTEFRLTADFACMLGIAFESWMGIILEIQLVVSNYPEKDYAANKWTKEYQRLCCAIGLGFAYFIEGKYEQGRHSLEEVRAPLQSIVALITNQLYNYNA